MILIIGMRNACTREGATGSDWRSLPVMRRVLKLVRQVLQRNFSASPSLIHNTGGAFILHERARRLHYPTPSPIPSGGIRVVHWDYLLGHFNLVCRKQKSFQRGNDALYSTIIGLFPNEELVVHRKQPLSLLASGAWSTMSRLQSNVHLIPKPVHL
jgi:hypothetical protein